MTHASVNRFQNEPSHRFSMTLERIRTSIEDAPGRLRLSEVISFFGPKGHALLSLFFVLPFLQPIPIPGLSVVLGVCISFFGFFMFLGRPPWLPERVAKIEVEKKFLLRVTLALESLLKKIERVVRPRLSEVCERRGFQALHGFLIGWHALLLALPLPIPFSNMIPAVCLWLIALGSLEEDFAVILAGYGMAIVSTVFFAMLVVAPFVLGAGIQSLA